jgi:similar to spore coat protein
MMANQGLAMHETLEIHELLVFKNVCCTKSSTMQALVTDTELKSILQKDVDTTKTHIRDLSSLLSRANLQ